MEHAITFSYERIIHLLRNKWMWSPTARGYSDQTMSSYNHDEEFVEGFGWTFNYHNPAIMFNWNSCYLMNQMVTLTLMQILVERFHGEMYSLSLSLSSFSRRGNVFPKKPQPWHGMQMCGVGQTITESVITKEVWTESSVNIRDFQNQHQSSRIKYVSLFLFPP